MYVWLSDVKKNCLGRDHAVFLWQQFRECVLDTYETKVGDVAGMPEGADFSGFSGPAQSNRLARITFDC